MTAKDKNHKLLTIIFSNTTILPSKTLWGGGGINNYLYTSLHSSEIF